NLRNCKTRCSSRRQDGRNHPAHSRRRLQNPWPKTHSHDAPTGRRLLHRPSRTALLQRTHGVHVERSVRRDGTRKRERRQIMARSDGRYRSSKSRRRHTPKRVRRLRRRKRRSRLRLGRKRSDRNLVFFQSPRIGLTRIKSTANEVLSAVQSTVHGAVAHFLFG